VHTTLSPVVCTEIRRAIGFDGVLVTDDLEMQAIAAHGSIDGAAVTAIAAGCDLVLVCHDFDAQERAHASLVREAERSSAFRARCEEAAGRVRRMRTRATARPVDGGQLAERVGGAASVAMQAEIARRLGA
jgi:beta-N-acetylhexosaminidase